MKIFQLAPWIAATLYSTAVTAGSLFPRQYGGYNITEDVLEVASSISSPTCNATQPCIELLTVVVPRCLRLRGDAGCWCGNHDPVHYCALCMSNPTDNTTTPDQTQGATNGHTRFHGGCAAFEAVINGTVASTTSSSVVIATTSAAATQANSNSGSQSKSNTGAIIGGAVGGVVGLALIAGICFIAYQMIKRKPAIDPYTQRPMSTVTSPELKYATPSPPPMQLPPAGSPQAFGQFAGQPPQPNGMTTYGSPLPYGAAPVQPPPNPQRESTYDTRML
ncbi:hypothetical protein FRC03_000480 [Tulasnella sp. 419]|nr:hypothetical protein FRC03_000480 [Tulasnella sp. 419]